MENQKLKLLGFKDTEGTTLINASRKRMSELLVVDVKDKLSLGIFRPIEQLIGIGVESKIKKEIKAILKSGDSKRKRGHE